MSNIEKTNEQDDTDDKQIESKNENKRSPTCIADTRGAPPKNISLRLWEKFKSLEKRTDEISQKYRERRNKTTRKSNSRKASEENEDGNRRSKHDITYGSHSKKSEESEEVEASSSSKGESRGNEEVKWEEVRELIDVNKHLDPGITYSRNELEKAIDKAVELGDIETAEQLSDKLATRQFGKKISDAFHAREYLKRKKAEEESVKQKKSKKLHWGFQEKERWETKGNM